jgi:hypothetical protein
LRELKNNYRTLPPKTLDRITNGLSTLECSKELEKNYRTLPLRITNKTIDRLKEFQKVGIQDFTTDNFKQYYR